MGAFAYCDRESEGIGPVYAVRVCAWSFLGMKVGVE